MEKKSTAKLTDVISIKGLQAAVNDRYPKLYPNQAMDIALCLYKFVYTPFTYESAIQDVIETGLLSNLEVIAFMNVIRPWMEDQKILARRWYDN